MQSTIAMEGEVHIQQPASKCSIRVDFNTPLSFSVVTFYRDISEVPVEC